MEKNLELCKSTTGRNLKPGRNFKESGGINVKKLDVIWKPGTANELNKNLSLLKIVF